jgi:hypothetical protein
MRNRKLPTPQQFDEYRVLMLSIVKILSKLSQPPSEP